MQAADATRLADILGDFPDVAAAWVFGSEARGQARPDSDVDLALLLNDRTKTALDVHRDLAAIAARAEAVFPGRPIDVVLIEPQGPIFAHRVLSEGKLVYDRNPARRVDFESDTYPRYFDFLPTYRLASERSLQGLKRWLEKRR